MFNRQLACTRSSNTNRPSWWLIHFTLSDAIHNDTTTFNMDVAHYWPMVREYSIRNAAIALLQFWTTDLDLVMLGSTTEEVYSACFYSSSSHTLHQQSDEILFGHFVIMLNAAFDWWLALADEGYESGSDTINLPTPLRKMLRIQHVSSIEHALFNPDPVTPQNMLQAPPRPVCRWLSFSSSDDDITPEVTLSTPRATPANTQEYLEDEEEEDFQMVPLNDDHSSLEEISDRTLCIHEHGLSHRLCLYPCPYANYHVLSYVDNLELSDIYDFEDIMITSSNEDIPALEDMPYWKNTGLIWTLHWHNLLTSSDILTANTSHKQTDLNWTFFFQQHKHQHISTYDSNKLLAPLRSNVHVIKILVCILFIFMINYNDCLNL